MKNKLCLIVCEVLRDEIQSIIYSEKLENIVIETLPCICYKSGHRDADEIGCIVDRNSAECSQFEIIGGACNKKLENLAGEIGNFHVTSLEQCFYMLANKTIVDNYISEGSYVITPGWLKNWKGYTAVWGFSKETAAEFFREFAKQVLLLDTGIDEKNIENLKEFSNFTGLTYQVVEVGLDYLHLFLAKIISRWNIQISDDKHLKDFTCLNKLNADYAVAFEFMREFTSKNSESDVIEKIFELCGNIFAPKIMYYVPIINNSLQEPIYKYGKNKEKWDKCNLDFSSEFLLSNSCKGFYLKVKSQNDVLGFLCLDEVAFPEYINQYLNLALAMSEICGLAISNARNYEKVMKSEREALEQRERYRKLIDILPGAMFVHDANKIQFCNKGALKLVGVEDINELKDKSILDFIPAKHHPVLLKSFERTLKEGENIFLQNEKVIQKSGKVIDVESNIILFEFEGSSSILHVMKDITERKQMEKMKKKIEMNKKIINEMVMEDKLKTEFFSNISHEFRTPLNVILGTLQLVELYQKNNSVNGSIEVLNKYIPAMKQNCFRLLRLINNLIDISRIDSGYFEMHLGNQNIIEIIRKITLSIKEFVESKDLTLSFSANVEEKIMACDPDKIERILLNLLSNAVKFTEPGGNITVSIYSQEDKIDLVVADTGIGIPKDKQSLVFERFKQIDKSFTRKNEGSGIGLSIVKSLVEMHQGSISVTSIPGKGSEFTVSLPEITLENGVHSLGNSRVQTIGNQVERIKIEFSDIYS